MERLVAEKFGAKTGIRTLFVNAPESFHDAAKFPAMDVKLKCIGDFDYIHFFVTTQKEFRQKFPKLKKHLKPKGALWISWPKSKQKETDLNLQKVIELGYDFGLVESKVIRLDETWSAIKFTHPIEGKIYQNSYGTLI